MKPKFHRKLNYFLASLLTRNYCFTPSDSPIDIIIPIIRKDLKVLPYCLQGIEHCVTNKIQDIFIVAPQDDDIINFCKKHELIFKDENDVLGFSPKDISYYVHGMDRSGWIFQQLLKLSGNIGNTPYFLVIDADHVLLSPHTFLTSDQKTIFYQSKEYHQPYYDMIYKLLGENKLTKLSFVSHKMLFSTKDLNRLKKQIFEHTQKSWVDAILSNLTTTEISCFSEYETYGYNFPSSERILLPWRNKNLPTSLMEPYDILVKKYGTSHRAITFPDYKK